MQGAYYNGRPKKGLVCENSKAMDIPMERFSIATPLTFAQAAAGTVFNVIPAARVGAGRRVRIETIKVMVGGATAWTIGTSVKIQDTAGNDLLTFLTAALTGNANLTDNSANVTPSAQYLASGGQPSADNVGLQVVGVGAFAAGSPLTIVINGTIE